MRSSLPLTNSFERWENTLFEHDSCFKTMARKSQSATLIAVQHNCLSESKEIIFNIQIKYHVKYVPTEMCFCWCCCTLKYVEKWEFEVQFKSLSFIHLITHNIIIILILIFVILNRTRGDEKTNFSNLLNMKRNFLLAV